MSKSKKIFLILSAIFLIILLIIAYDMAKRTTFPGQDDQKTGKDSVSASY